jgi:hypothetical protein
MKLLPADQQTLRQMVRQPTWWVTTSTLIANVASISRRHPVQVRYSLSQAAAPSATPSAAHHRPPFSTLRATRMTGEEQDGVETVPEALRRLARRIRSYQEGPFPPSPPPSLLFHLTDELLVDASNVVSSVGAEGREKLLRNASCGEGPRTVRKAAGTRSCHVAAAVAHTPAVATRRFRFRATGRFRFRPPRLPGRRRRS